MLTWALGPHKPTSDATIVDVEVDRRINTNELIIPDGYASGQTKTLLKVKQVEIIVVLLFRPSQNSCFASMTPFARVSTFQWRSSESSGGPEGQAGLL